MALPQDNVSAQLSKDLSYSDGAAIVVATPFLVCDGIYIGGAGNATVTLQSGRSVAFNGLLAGTILQVKAVNVTAATATNMVALYK